jgi:small subunit ribosomal protein S13
MPRIAGTDIPDNKRTEIALTYLYGIGRSNVQEIIKAANLDPR